MSKPIGPDEIDLVGEVVLDPFSGATGLLNAGTWTIDMVADGLNERGYDTESSVCFSSSNLWGSDHDPKRPLNRSPQRAD